jgi:hypothetical protein
LRFTNFKNISFWKSAAETAGHGEDNMAVARLVHLTNSLPLLAGDVELPDAVERLAGDLSAVEQKFYQTYLKYSSIF